MITLLKGFNMPTTILSIFSTAVPRRGRPGASIVRASFFGVGAPEAVVVGVVALLVFGPKGEPKLADCTLPLSLGVRGTWITFLLVSAWS